MSYKFFYLYLAGGTVALLLLIYKVIANYPAVSFKGVFLYTIPVILLYYMAYKVRREKEDKDLM
jgi:hypothetical protein